MKEVHLIYFSPTDSTKEVCTAIGGGLGYKMIHHDATLPENRRLSMSFSQEQLCIIGAPVHSGRLPKVATDYYRKLHGHNTKVVLVVVYGNRSYGDALLELKDLCEDSGFKPVAASAFVGEHSIARDVAAGRPDTMDLVKAKELGKAIATKLEKIDETKWLSLKVKGNHPYRDVIRKHHDLVPSTDIQCNQCGICVKHCPTGAIHKERVEIVNASQCIRCFSCVKRCPKQAKNFNQDVVRNVQAWLVENCKDFRNEPEIYI